MTQSHIIPLPSLDDDDQEHLWLIVPAHNEESRLGATLMQYRMALSNRDRIVIVVNGSHDQTEDVARRAAGEDDRLIVIVQHQKIGKGGALIAGLRFVRDHATTGDVVAYTDADAAVAGDEIVRFCAGVQPGELRIGSRWHDPTTQIRRQPALRQLASRAFNLYVRTMMQLNVKDTQCAAKAIRAERLPELLERLDTRGFAFDIDLISSGMLAGLAINEVPVLWTDQEGSTVSLRRAVPNMMIEVLRLRRKYGSMADARATTFGSTGQQLASISEPNHSEDGAVEFGELPPSNGDRPQLSPNSNSSTPISTDSNGVASAGPKIDHRQMPSARVVRSVESLHEVGSTTVAHGELAEPTVGSLTVATDPSGSNSSDKERARVLSNRQKVLILALVAATAAGLTTATVVTLVTITAALTLLFAVANLTKIDLIRRAERERSCKPPIAEQLTPITDEQLPPYTILLPLYHEDSMLHQLIDGILALDYPREKLDVKLLLEEDDEATLSAVERIDLPACFEVVTVPDDGPRGKPRACNAGLARAKGRYLVIYDAEDCPEGDQLRRSVRAFESASPNVVCMQAKLNYFNRAHNLLTRWFTAEYSLWFDLLLPGLQSLDVAIPLGGTSNHFITARLRELGGWDQYNVTEDAELGVRLYLQGWKTAILDSTTFEEATSRYHNWLRQRSRWIKGYMHTYLRVMSHPIALYRQMGAKAFAMLQLFFGAATFCVLINPLFWLLTIVWFADHYHPIQLLFPQLLLYLGIVGMFVGNAAFALAAVSGAYIRRNFGDVKWALLAPVYWVLMSIAAWKALIQLCYKPFYWEKTVHGHCLYPSQAVPATEGVDVGK